jgi:hypothetical protein
MNKKWIAILLVAGMFVSCNEHPNLILPAANGLPVNVNVLQNQPGGTLPPAFQGLSFETGILAEDPGFLNVNNKVLIQLIKNLGPGILRIGGNSSDEVYWAGKTRNGNAKSVALTKTDIDRLSAFSSAVGWKVLFGLNLGSNDVAAATDEANYVYTSLHGNLYAFQAGNEPDAYIYSNLRAPNYTYHHYRREWKAYFTAVRKAVPNIPFAGPDVANNIDWITVFAKDEKTNISLLDGHFYETGPASDPAITCQSILDTNGKSFTYLLKLHDISIKYHLPFRITESNNVYGGGKAGVSNVFASALWALDLMWNVAENNGQGINFHGGKGLIYSPIAFGNGYLIARPEYYAMLAYKYGSKNGKIIPAYMDQPAYNCSAFACINDKNTFITLINKDDKNNFSFIIKLVKNASTITIARLTAPAITSAAGTSFAGGVVSAEGVFKPPIAEKYTVNQKSFVVNIPAGSAAVITVD